MSLRVHAEDVLYACRTSSNLTKISRMKNKSPTLKEIEKGWWWKREDIIQNGVSGVDWEVVKDAARNYELMRRAPEAILPFSKQPYLELGGEMQMLVHQVWVKWEHPCRYAIRTGQYEETGWTPVYENQHTQWNLRLPDNVLAVEFIRQIRNFRGAQNIQIGHSLKGKKNRSASWNYIELLDRMACADKTPFTASERHMLSKARRLATKYAREFNQAYEEWKNRPSDPFMAALTALSYPDGAQTVGQVLTGLSLPPSQ
jgi:hypothetical protein